MTTNYWKFVKLKDENWAWQLQTPDGRISRVGPFPTLEKCITNAQEYGYEESALNRMNDQRPVEGARALGCSRPRCGQLLDPAQSDF